MAATKVGAPRTNSGSASNPYLVNNHRSRGAQKGQTQAFIAAYAVMSFLPAAAACALPSEITKPKIAASAKSNLTMKPPIILDDPPAILKLAANPNKMSNSVFSSEQSWTSTG